MAHLFVKDLGPYECPEHVLYKPLKRIDIMVMSAGRDIFLYLERLLEARVVGVGSRARWGGTCSSNAVHRMMLVSITIKAP